MHNVSSFSWKQYTEEALNIKDIKHKIRRKTQNTQQAQQKHQTVFEMQKTQPNQKRRQKK